MHRVCEFTRDLKEFEKTLKDLRYGASRVVSLEVAFGKMIQQTMGSLSSLIIEMEKSLSVATARDYNGLIRNNAACVQLVIDMYKKLCYALKEVCYDFQAAANAFGLFVEVHSNNPHFCASKWVSVVHYFNTGIRAISSIEDECTKQVEELSSLLKDFVHRVEHLLLLLSSH